MIIYGGNNMNVIVKNNDGTYYASKVFGIINNKVGVKYEQGWSYKYVVLNKTGNNILIIDEYAKTKHNIITYDTDKTDMTLDKNNIGKVNFLTEEEYAKILNNQITEDIIKKCQKYVVVYKDEYVDILTDKDINNVIEIFFGFHDAYVYNICENKDELKVTFLSEWGCNLEMVFSGNVTYKNMRTTQEGDLWWYDATIIIQEDKENNYRCVKLIDNADYKPEDDIEKFQCFFIGDKAKYRIIPN